MSEQRIKATLHVDKCMVGRIVRVKSDEQLPPPGTEVEIVYREPEVEIRPGQRWRITHVGECGAVCHVQISGDKWQIANENHVVCSIRDPFDDIRCYEKAELQSWLNEHATLVE